MFGLIGISYKSAPLEVREKYSFTKEDSLLFLKQLQIDPDLMGGVVLSTCNRIEIYFHYEKCCAEKAYQAIIRNLEFFKKTSKEERKYFYEYQGDAASEHLFRVVSGLESLVVGEDQIVTQVKSCFKISLDHDLSSSVLTRMFNKAFEAGKRVRTETAINRGSASISSAAVEMLLKHVPDITDKKITLVGTGVMGELAVVNLVKKNCRSLYITNRTYNNAAELAQKYNLKAFAMEELNLYLPQSDVIMVATGAQNHIITKEMVETFAGQRKEKQIYMDLSVPRNISTAITTLPNTVLFAVDDLQEIVKDTKNKRKEAESEAMEIISIVKQEFNDWLCALGLTPSILKIKNNIEQVSSGELEGFLKVNGLGDNEMVSRYADHISNKYARLFIKNLKMVTNNGKNSEYLNVVNRLFELNNSHEQ